MSTYNASVSGTVELVIPNGFEFVAFRKPTRGEFYIGWNATAHRWCRQVVALGYGDKITRLPVVDTKRVVVRRPVATAWASPTPAAQARRVDVNVGVFVNGCRVS